MTLPLIAALDRATAADRARIRRIVRARRKSRAETAEVVRFVTEHGGAAYARARMEALADDAAAGPRRLPALRRPRRARRAVRLRRRAEALDRAELTARAAVSCGSAAPPR